MGKHCCVINCRSESRRDKEISFHRLPKVLKPNYPNSLLSHFRRERWLSAIKGGPNFSKGKLENWRVCSKHFITGKPASLKDDDHPDWVPCINMGYKMGDIPENSMTTFMKLEESTNQIAKSSPVGMFTCSLCGLKFSQEEYLTNHFKFCKDVEDPADKLGVDIITIKKELKTEDEMHRMEMFDEHTTTEPILHIKLEEIDFTETTISGTATPQSGQLIENLKTEPPEELSTLTKGDYTTAQSTQLQEHVEVDKPGKP